MSRPPSRLDCRQCWTAAWKGLASKLEARQGRTAVKVGLPLEENCCQAQTAVRYRPPSEPNGDQSGTPIQVGLPPGENCREGQTPIKVGLPPGLDSRSITDVARVFPEGNRYDVFSLVCRSIPSLASHDGFPHMRIFTRRIPSQICLFEFIKFTLIRT